jgi:hypothetical protein
MRQLKNIETKKEKQMNNDFVTQTIRNLMSVVCALEPDPQWREEYMIDEVLKDADTAIQMLTKGDE